MTNWSTKQRHLFYIEGSKNALEEAAKIAEAYPDGERAWIIHKASQRAAGRAIAARIRALAAALGNNNGGDDGGSDSCA